MDVLCIRSAGAKRGGGSSFENQADHDLKKAVGSHRCVVIGIDTWAAGSCPFTGRIGS